MRQRLTKNRFLRISAIILSVLLILFIIPFFIPMTTQAIFGNKIIKDHIEHTYTKNASLDQNINESFNWLNHSYIPYGDDIKFPLYGINNGFYNIDNKTVLFIRPSFVSWFILIKTGNCGEHADYLTEIFKRLGYDVRKIYAAGGDHTIVQVVQNNISFFIDPSSKTRFQDTNYFENGQWARIMAIKTNGTEIDLTNEVLTNKSEITLFKNSSKKIKAILSSTYLMKRGGMYKKPILVYQFDLTNNSDSVIVTSSEDYVIEYYTDFFIYKFSIEKDLNLTKDIKLYTEKVPITFKNFKITTLGYVILLIPCLLIFYFSFNLIINKFQKLFLK